MMKRILAIILALCFSAAVFTSCGEQAPSEVIVTENPIPAAASASAKESKAAVKHYKAPEMLLSEFHKDKAEGSDDVLIDLSALSSGYVAVSAESDHKLKFRSTSGENEYTYDLSSDGSVCVFPLQWGDGSYDFIVLENVSDTKYSVKYSTTCDVKLDDEFQPFLRPSEIVNYDSDSTAVKKAKELSSDAEDAIGVVTAVYDFVCDNITYDKDKAQSVTKGYLPDPDSTLEEKKGICFDYAALAATMLRSQGIPCKVIFGYVSPNDLYHAWNMFYTEETGWVTVDYKVSGDSWNRLDLTFSVTGADSSFVGDGTNYADVYFF